MPSPVQKLERMERQLREVLEDMESLQRQQERRATDLLERRDYSGAATACHRAHQALLRVQLIREVLA